MRMTTMTMTKTTRDKVLWLLDVNKMEDAVLLLADKIDELEGK